MSEHARDFIFRQKFLDELFSIQEYLNFHGGEKSKYLMEDVIDFCVDIIVSNPFAFPECYFLKTDTQLYRRAIFRREYAIVYKVTPLLIDILTIYHTSRDDRELSVE
ncbi:MAG: type II toxin-antitoxin system RelE/ParE family toxin [Spirosomataceae bacterium]